MQPEYSHHGGNREERMSSSSSSFDPFLDLDDNENDILDTSINKHGQDSPISPVSVVKSAAEWSMISSSPGVGPPMSSPELSPLTPEWSTAGASTKQSPPIQTMGSPGLDYDPNRIPSSIFTSKPANPMDWSMASNESLFSIHMGNNSFKSGELSPVMEAAAENHGRSYSMWEDPGVNEAEGQQTKVVTKETTEDHSNESVARTERVCFSIHGSKCSDGGEIPPADGVRTYASTPRLSHESGNSSKSFAFPVFTREGGRSASMRVAPDMFQLKPLETSQSQPQPQPQPQAQAVCPKPTETGWFSCFSCCPNCC